MDIYPMKVSKVSWGNRLEEWHERLLGRLPKSYRPTLPCFVRFKETYSLAGRCGYPTPTYKVYDILLSSYMTEREAYETYAHELAHAVVHHVRGGDRETHGFYWGHVMILLGFDPGSHVKHSYLLRQRRSAAMRERRIK